MMFSRSRCLLWTVSQSLRIFSLTRLISLAVNWSATESSCSSSSSLIISSRQERSRSIFSRSRLSMYIRDAVQRARFYQIQRNGEREKEEHLTVTFRSTPVYRCPQENLKINSLCIIKKHPLTVRQGLS